MNIHNKKILIIQTIMTVISIKLLILLLFIIKINKNDSFYYQH